MQMKMMTVILSLVTIGAVAIGFMPYDPSKEFIKEAEEKKTEATTAEMTTMTNPTMEETKDTEIETTKETSTHLFRGHITDENGTIVWYSSGTERLANDTYDVCLANLISDSSYIQLDKRYEKWLRSENPTFLLAENEYNEIGASVQMTIDADTQLEAYNILEAAGIKGSITIVDDVGRVECAASYPSFSHNEYIKDPVLTKRERDSFNNQAFIPATPGSIFKVLSGTVAARYGIFSMVDKGREERYDYQNWDWRTNSAQYPCERTLQQAILNSSNYWFGNLFYELGSDKVCSTLDEYFCFGEDIECDFGTLSQSMHTGDNSALSRTGFGQRVSVSPIYMAAVGSAVVTGELVKPYTADKLLDTVNLQTIAIIGKKEVLRTIPKEHTAALLEGMEMVTADIGLSADEGYTIYSKTGTAEIDANLYTDFLYILSVVKNEATGEVKTVVIQVQNPEECGYTYARDAAPVMQEVLNTIIR